MAKLNGKTITIGTIIAIITLGLVVMNQVWSQGGSHAVEEARLDNTIVRVNKNAEDIDIMDTKVTVLETRQQAILSGVEDIQDTQKQILEKLP